MEQESQPLTVGLTYNLKKGIGSDVEDIEAEYDSMDTVLAIKNALEKGGCKVELLEADTGLFEKLSRVRVDIVFNIAEGTRGRGREAQVPALLNFYGIPFTGSDETTLCISLDKALAKRLLSSYKIRTPGYQVISDEKTPLKNRKFPLIIKPNAEGSSKGISGAALVHNPDELKKELKEKIRIYGQPFLVEEFIEGREFTVGIVGNGAETKVFQPMEIVFVDKEASRGIYSFQVKRDFKRYVRYVCPPELKASLIKEMMDTAGKVYRVLECRDFARVDFRMAYDNRLYFIEINPLPGLSPGYSDFPMLAEFNGVDYDRLILTILNSALKRYGMRPLGPASAGSL